MTPVTSVLCGLMLYRTVKDPPADTCDRAVEQVVNKGYTLSGNADASLGQHDVVIYKCRAVGYLDPQIFSHSQPLCEFLLEKMVP